MKKITAVNVQITFFPRGPKIIYADDGNTEYRCRGEASIKLLTEVFTKIMDFQMKGVSIILTLDKDGYIIETP
jgi:hypothetical protein